MEKRKRSGFSIIKFDYRLRKKGIRAGYTMLIPLALLFVLLSFLAMHTPLLMDEIRLSVQSEHRLKIHTYRVNVLQEVVSFCSSLEAETTDMLVKDGVINRFEIKWMNQKQNSAEKQVIWYMDLNGFSYECSFIMEGGKIKKWNYW